MRQGVLLSLVFGLSLVSGAMAQKPKSAGAPEVSAERTLAEALVLSGKNRPELEDALLSVAEGELRDGMKFLIRYMPERDLKALDSDFLAIDVLNAFLERRAHDWAKEVPIEIFYNDVLPYAVLNEKREGWRTDFRQRFAPMVKDAKTLRDAALIVNKAIKDEVKVDYSTKREKADQSPSESMKSGMASCSGLSILLCDALRSVGIPARVAGTPSWTTKRGNHNWVEFYDPATEKWHFTEYYLDSKGIDRGWFVADASKGIPGDFAHAIYASSWKPTGKCFPLVWDMDINYVNAVDVTERYIAYGKRDGVGIPKGMCELRIDFVDAGDRREAVKIRVMDVDGFLVGEGVTPDLLADMNDFLTIRVKQGRTYSLNFIEEEPSVSLLSKKFVEISDDDRFLEIRGSIK